MCAAGPGKRVPPAGPCERHPMRLAIISDIHYAGPMERKRRDHLFAPIKSPLRRWATRQYRRWVWLRDPFAHNHLLDRFLDQTRDADLALANGDYSCDTAYIGLCDDAAYESARECLGKLRAAFGPRLLATIGDHEIGKKMLAANEGGLRLASYRRAVGDLGLAPVWKHVVGKYVLVGVTSTLAAFPLMAGETLPEERAPWEEVRGQHRAALQAIFDGLQPEARLLLFCHDPSALPFLGREEFVRRRLPQIERTIIGHLHSNAVFRQAQRLAGMPVIKFLGHTPARLSAAVREARHWQPFKPLLCPSPPGMQLLKDGGYYVVTLDPAAREPARFEFRALPW